MAGQNRIVNETFTASGDLSAMQHRFVDYVGAGDVIGHALADGGMGVLLNKPQDGEFAQVALSGRVRVDAGIAVTAGDYIISAASGFAVPVTLASLVESSFLARKTVMGRAMETVASGSVFGLELNVTPGVSVNSA